MHLCHGRQSKTMSFEAGHLVQTQRMYVWYLFAYLAICLLYCSNVEAVTQSMLADDSQTAFEANSTATGPNATATFTAGTNVETTEGFIANNDLSTAVTDVTVVDDDILLTSDDRFTTKNSITGTVSEPDQIQTLWYTKSGSMNRSFQ